MIQLKQKRLIGIGNTILVWYPLVQFKMCVFCSWLIVGKDCSWLIVHPWWTSLGHVIVCSGYHEFHFLKYKEQQPKQQQQQPHITNPVSCVMVAASTGNSCASVNQAFLSCIIISTQFSTVLQSCLEANLPYSFPEHFSRMRRGLWKFHPCNKVGVYYNCAKTKQWGMWS